MIKRLLALLLLTPFLYAETTPNMGIDVVEDGAKNWGARLRANWYIIDSSSAVLPINLETSVTGILPAENMVSTAVFTNEQNFFTDANEFQQITATSITVNGPLNVSGLTANQCVQTGAGGLLTVTGAACGGSGGSSALAVNQNGVQVTSPTIAINMLSPPFIVTAVGGGTTAQISLDGSSVTLRGNNVIFLGSTLQAGSTFYVSSGTVVQLTSNKIITSTLSVTGNGTIDVLRVTGAGGLTVDNLAAGECVQTGVGGLLEVSGSACAGTPALPNESIQFNSGGAFGGDSALTWDVSEQTLKVLGGLSVSIVDSLLEVDQFGVSVSTLSASSATVTSGNIRDLYTESLSLTNATGKIQSVLGGIGVFQPEADDFYFNMSGGGKVMLSAESDGLGFISGSGDGAIILKSSDSIFLGGHQTFTLWDRDGTSGQTLSTDGNKNLYWSTPSGGGSSLPLPEGATNYIQNRDTLQAGATAYPEIIYAQKGTFTSQLNVGDPLVGSTGNQILTISPSGLGTNDNSIVRHAHCLFGTCSSYWDVGMNDNLLRWSVYSVLNSTSYLIVDNVEGKVSAIGPDGLYVKYGAVFSTATVNDDAYAAGWDSNLEVPTKNALYDKIETISAGGGTPGLPVNSVQFNSAGSFGGDSDFNWSGSSLTVSGQVQTSTLTILTDAVTSGNTQKGALDVYMGNVAGAGGTVIASFGTNQEPNQILFIDQRPLGLGDYGATLGELSAGLFANPNNISSVQSVQSHVNFWNSGEMEIKTATSGNGGKDITFYPQQVEALRLSNTGGATFTSSATFNHANGARVRTDLVSGFLTVTGTATVNGQSVCLEDGTDCPAGGAGDAVLASTQTFTGWNTFASTSGVTVGFGVSAASMTLTNSSTATTLKIDPNGVAPVSTSVGGAILLENTGNTGAGFIIYSNAGASTGRLMNIRADNAAFDQPALHVDYDGTANGVEIVGASTDGSAVLLNITNTNPNDTTVGISGAETGKGTVKITHDGTGNDGNASALSLRSNGTGTDAQGIFFDAEQGTTGKMMNFRNLGTEYFVLYATAAADHFSGVEVSTINIKRGGTQHFWSGNGTNFVAFRAAGSGVTNSTYTWPVAYPGSSQVLQSDTGGALTWVTAGGGTPSTPLNSVQFNSAGSFGGSGNFNWSGSSLSVLGAPVHISSAAFIGTNSGGTNIIVKGGSLFSSDGSYGGASSAAVAIYQQTPAGTGTRLLTIGTDQQLNQFVIADRIPPVFGIGIVPGSLTIGAVGKTHSIETNQNTNVIEIWRTGTGGDMYLTAGSGDAGSIKLVAGGAEKASFDNVGITFTSSITVVGNVKISSDVVMPGATFYHNNGGASIDKVVFTTITAHSGISSVAISTGAPLMFDVNRNLVSSSPVNRWDFLTAGEHVWNRPSWAQKVRIRICGAGSGGGGGNGQAAGIARAGGAGGGGGACIEKIMDADYVSGSLSLKLGAGGAGGGGGTGAVGIDGLQGGWSSVYVVGGSTLIYAGAGGRGNGDLGVAQSGGGGGGACGDGLNGGAGNVLGGCPNTTTAQPGAGGAGGGAAITAAGRAGEFGGGGGGFGGGITAGGTAGISVYGAGGGGGAGGCTTGNVCAAPTAGGGTDEPNLGATGGGGGTLGTSGASCTAGGAGLAGNPIRGGEGGGAGGSDQDTTAAACTGGVGGLCGGGGGGGGAGTNVGAAGGAGGAGCAYIWAW